MSASSLSDAFAACLAYDARQPGPAELIGLEHEYRVLCDGRGLDFRELIHHLDIGGRRIDPADTNAYRLASGLALTCDEAEAEIATPPLALAPGFTLELDAWALAGRTQLSSLLPPGHTVEGFSTHLSASFAGRDPNAVINLFSRTFAPVLMPILDGPDSFGIYLRPRPGRIELCGEYVAGDYLRATAAVFAGGVRACASVVEGEVRSWQSLPPMLDIHLRPAQGRFGTYIGRSSAFDYDLYEAGRAAQLPLIAGGTTTLQAQLERAWLAAKACLSDASAADVEVAEAIVEGKTSFRTETGEGAAEAETNKAGLALDREWLGRVLPLRRRPNFTVEAMSATWAFTLFRIVGPTGLAFACLPRGALRSFLEQLDAGTLDSCLQAYLEVQHEGRRLSSPAETLAPGLWDSVADGLQLISPEPDAVTRTFPRAMAGSEFARLETPGTPRAGKVAATPSTFDHVRGRPGKSTDDRRPGKPLVVPARTQIIPSGLPGPFAPEPTAPEEPVVGDLSPTLPAAPSPKPPSPRPRATHYLVPLAGIVVVVIGVVVAAVAGAFTGGASPGLVPAPTTTPTPTATWTPTSTPLPSATAPAVSPPQPSPSRIATTRPTETPIVTPRPTVTTIASATPTRTRTPVLDLTRTPTPCATAGAVCSPTPTRTRTPGAPIN